MQILTSELKCAYSYQPIALYEEDGFLPELWPSVKLD